MDWDLQCENCGVHYTLSPGDSLDGAITNGMACHECGGKRFLRNQPSPTQSDGTLRDMVDSDTQIDQGGNPLGEGTIMGDDGERPFGKRDNFMHAGYGGDWNEASEIERLQAEYQHWLHEDPDVAREVFYQIQKLQNEEAMRSEHHVPEPPPVTEDDFLPPSQRLKTTPEMDQSASDLTLPKHWGHKSVAVDRSLDMEPYEMDGLFDLPNDYRSLPARQAGSLWNSIKGIGETALQAAPAIGEAGLAAAAPIDQEIPGLDVASDAAVADEVGGIAGGVAEDAGKSLMQKGLDAAKSKGMSTLKNQAINQIKQRLPGGGISGLMKGALGMGAGGAAGAGLAGGAGGAAGASVPTDPGWQTTQPGQWYGSADLPMFLLADAAHLETSDSVKSLGEQHGDDPEKVDTKEFNDQDKSPSNHKNPNNEDSGAAGEDGVRAEKEGYGFGPNSPGIDRAMMLLPLILHYFQSEESGENDPLIKGLHDMLEQENPGYLQQQHPDSHNIVQEIISLHKPHPGEEQQHAEHTAGVNMNPMDPQQATDPFPQVNQPVTQMQPQTGSRCPQCNGVTNPDGSCPQCGQGAQQPGMVSMPNRVGAGPGMQGYPAVIHTKGERQYSDHPYDAAVFYNPDRRALFVAPEGGHHWDIINEVPNKFLGDNPARAYLRDPQSESPQFIPTWGSWESNGWSPEDVEHSYRALQRYYPNVQMRQSNTVGPMTPEQRELVIDYLNQHGRSDETPNVELHPEQYADVLAEITGAQPNVPPLPNPNQVTPLVPQPSNPGAMPVPDPGAAAGPASGAPMQPMSSRSAAYPMHPEDYSNDPLAEHPVVFDPQNPNQRIPLNHLHYDDPTGWGHDGMMGPEQLTALEMEDNWEVPGGRGGQGLWNGDPVRFVPDDVGFGPVHQGADSVAPRCPECGSGSTGTRPGPEGITFECAACHNIWERDDVDVNKYKGAKVAADSVAPRCPKCHSGSTGTRPGPEGITFECSACHNIWERDDVDVNKYKGASFVIEGLVDVPNPNLQRDDSHMAWKDVMGNDLAEGTEYEISSAAFNAPTYATVLKVHPNHLDMKISGGLAAMVNPDENTPDFQIPRKEAQMDDYQFTPVNPGGDMDDHQQPPDTMGGTPGYGQSPPSGQTTDEMANSYPNMTTSAVEEEEEDADQCVRCGSTMVDHAMEDMETTRHSCVPCGHEWKTSSHDEGREAAVDLSWLLDSSTDDDFWSGMERANAMREAGTQSRDLGAIVARDPRYQEIHRQLAANAMQREAGKHFSPSEKRALINEKGRARNLEDLDLNNTHYDIREDFTGKANGLNVREDDLIFGI